MDEIIKVINEWDPIGFFPLAPKNEYFNEVKCIYDFMQQNQDIRIEKLAAKINEIFLHAFGTEIYNTDMEACKIVAEKILNVV
ncbi:MAG: DUF1871 family protein [Clostridia bacterium]|nr:DUF1871 family protein [Clostridia bacterium]